MGSATLPISGSLGGSAGAAAASSPPASRGVSTPLNIIDGDELEAILDVQPNVLPMVPMWGVWALPFVNESLAVHEDSHAGVSLIVGSYRHVMSQRRVCVLRAQATRLTMSVRA